MRTAIPRGREGARGFTLVELLIVVGVLGVLYAIGSISFRGLMPQYYLRSSSRSLGSAIEEMRLVAVTRGSWTGIRYVLDPPSSSENPYFQKIPPAPETDPGQPVEERLFLARQPLPNGVRFARIVLANGQAVDRGAVNVFFSPMGNSGSHVAVLEGADKRLVSVKLNAITGTIEFLDGGEAGFQNFED